MCAAYILLNSCAGWRRSKLYLSTFFQAITGPRLQFFDLIASWPGSVHDSRIFDNSRARVRFETKRLPGVLLGDAGYACMPFLLTPLANAGPANSPEGRYQASHIRTRNSIERAFGVWKRRFPCLNMGLQLKKETSVTVMTACAALHNLAILRKDPEPPTAPAQQHQRWQQPESTPQGDTVNGARARARLIDRAFR